MSALTPDLSGLLIRETALEDTYKPVALALSVDTLLPGDIKFQKYTAAYATFAKTTATPDLLVDAESHIREFIQVRGYVDAEAEGAALWVIWKIWARKLESKAIYTTGLLESAIQAKAARDQKVALFQAVNRLAKDAKQDSFAVGFKAKVTDVLNDAGAHQLAGHTAPVEAAVKELLTSESYEG